MAHEDARKAIDLGHSIANTLKTRIQANAVDARSFFASLVKGTEYSVAIHPAVQGNITVNLSDVTLDEVLDRKSTRLNSSHAR